MAGDATPPPANAQANPQANPQAVDPSPYQQMIGYEVTAWGPGHVTVELDLDERHKNRRGNPHGGALMTLMDAACTRAGAIDADSGEIYKTATVNLSTNFVGVAQGGKLRVEGRNTGGGRRLFFAEAHAYDGEGNLVATAVGTCRYASANTSNTR